MRSWTGEGWHRRSGVVVQAGVEVELECAVQRDVRPEQRGEAAQVVRGESGVPVGFGQHPVDQAGVNQHEGGLQQVHFFKTELELGHCLRLPAEGPCECDLYLTCAKFVTTADYVPRLRARREVEETLALDAADRGWAREVERHRCTANRIESLLTDLGETLDEPTLDTSANVD